MSTLVLFALLTSPQGLVPVANGLATGRTLRPTGSAITAEAPADGWAWYRPQAAAEGSAIYIAASDDDTFRILLTAGGASEPARFLEVMKAVEADLRQAWASRGAQLTSFSYKEPANFPGVLRYAAQASHPHQGPQQIVGYVLLGTPTVTVQGIITSPNEPSQLRQVAASVRRIASPVVPRQARWLPRFIYTGEAVISFALVGLLWRYAARRPRGPSTRLFDDGDV